MIVSDNVDYATRNGSFVTNISVFYGGHRWQVGSRNYNQISYVTGVDKTSSNLSGNLSSNETRVKSKFFSLMIYAGYPMQ